MQNSIQQNSKIPLLISWLFITSASPFVIWSWPYHPHKLLIFFLLSLIVFKLLKAGSICLSRGFISSFFLLIFYESFCLVYFEDITHITVLIQLFSIMLLLIYLSEYVTFELFVKTYIYAILYMAIGGTIIFFLHLFIGVEPLFSSDYGGVQLSRFLYLTTTNSYVNEGGLRIIRYSGFFDESGAFSLYSLYAVLLNRLYSENAKTERLLIFFSIFSMSFAFCISIICYYILFYLKNVKIVLFIAISAFSFYNIIDKYQNENPTMKRLAEYTIVRFEKDDDGDFRGNSRKELENEDKETFFSYPLLGAGKARGANRYGILASSGIIGTFIHYVPLLLILYYILKCPISIRTEGLKIYFLLLIQIFHRPNILSVLSLVIMFCFWNYYRRNSISQY